MGEAGEDTAVSGVPQTVVRYFPVFDTAQAGYGNGKIGTRWQRMSKSAAPRGISYVLADTDAGAFQGFEDRPARLEANAAADLSPVGQELIEGALIGVRQSMRQKDRPDPTAGNARARAATQRQRLGDCRSPDGFPAFDAAQALAPPALTRTDGSTIGCQMASAYTPWVPIHAPNQVQSLRPISQSEWPDRPARTNPLALGGASHLHPAPLSRAKVETLWKKLAPGASRPLLTRCCVRGFRARPASGAGVG